MATEKSVLLVIRASRPSFRSNHDKVAFVVHASFLAAGHVVTAVGAPAFSDSALSSTSNEEVGIDGWNEIEGEFAFVYINPDKGFKKTLVKCLVLNEKLLVEALADGSSEPVHYEINVDDYGVVEEAGDRNYSAQFQNFDKLVKAINRNILAKLDGSSKPGSSSNPQSSKTSQEPSTLITEPDAAIFDRSRVQIHPPGVIYPPVVPFGGSDLIPGPGAGVYPQRHDFGGGSMLLGPNDPRWFGGVGNEPGFPGRQPGVPPGARFDPYGPPGVPGFEPNRFGSGRGRGRGPRGGIHPDLEHFGSGSDFI